MSQTASKWEEPEMGNVGGDDYEQPRSAPYPTPQSEFLLDGSGPLFSTYSRMEAREADNVVELLQKGADGILIFAGSFSAVVTSFLALSLEDLKSNPQGSSGSYLEKIYYPLGDTDPSRTSFPNIADKPPIFSPPKYAAWINSLLFLSLVISLTSAILAGMLYRWAGRYKRLTQPLRSTVDVSHVLWVTLGARAMVHLSMFLFFAGLLIYLFNICHTAFAVVVSCMILTAVAYGSFTLRPIFHSNSPYYARLSSIFWSNCCRSVPLQALREGLYFRDSSGLQVFSMYSKLVEEKDKKMVDRWQREAEWIFTFSNLYSIVGSMVLVYVTIPDSMPNPPGNSEFYLKNIYQFLSHRNNSCQPPFPPANSSTFSPKSAIWVNSLLVLSVLISLTCTMLAKFIHKWARRYISITGLSQYSPHKRARLSAFFSGGVDKCLVSWAIEALPTLLHISLILFFIGILIYIFTTNHTVVGNVIWCVVLSMVAYLIIALLPISYLYITIRYTAFKVLSSPAVRCVHVHTADHFRRLKESCYNQFLEDTGKTAEEIAWKQASVVDIRLLESTFDTLGEVGAHEEFFAAVPGFFEPELVNGLKDHITGEFRVKFREALDRSLERTLSLSSVPESVRSRRLVISLDAAQAALGFNDVLQILWEILDGRWPYLTQSVEVIQSLRHWAVKNDEFTPHIQRIVAQAVVDVRERGESWISLVKDEFDLPDNVTRKYIAHGNSVLLSILIHITSRTIRTGLWTPRVLLSLSGFTIHDTLPGLQHAFCTLWNDTLLEARVPGRGPDNIHVEVLRELRHVYIDLHRGTDACPTVFSGATYDDPRSYRFCNIANHQQDITGMTIDTPISGSFILPSPKKLDQSPGALPHHSPLRHRLTPRGISATLESSANHATFHMQGFTWPSGKAKIS